MDFTVSPGRFRNKIVLLLIVCSGCKGTGRNVTVVPGVVVNVTDPALRQQEGFLYRNNKKFSGRTIELYPNGDTAQLTCYVDGREEGWSRKWYANKELMEERFYSSGKKEDVHKGWWPDGNPKFEYHFDNDEHEGEAKEWYSNGNRYRFFNYSKGHEEGLQQMWWLDGRVRANYVVKNGELYGLAGRKLCKNMLNEK